MAADVADEGVLQHPHRHVGAGVAEAAHEELPRYAHAHDDVFAKRLHLVEQEQGLAVPADGLLSDGDGHDGEVVVVEAPAGDLLRHLVAPVHQVDGGERVGGAARRLREETTQRHNVLEQNGLLGLLHDLQVERVLEHRQDERGAPSTVLPRQRRTLEVEEVVLAQNHTLTLADGLDEDLRSRADHILLADDDVVPQRTWDGVEVRALTSDIVVRDLDVFDVPTQEADATSVLHVVIPGKSRPLVVALRTGQAEVVVGELPVELDLVGALRPVTPTTREVLVEGKAQAGRTVTVGVVVEPSLNLERAVL